MVTEQSHVPVTLFLYFGSKVIFALCVFFYYTCYSFYLVTLVLMPFVALGSDLLWLIPVQFDSTASIFIFVRIGFEPFNNLIIILQY